MDPDRWQQIEQLYNAALVRNGQERDNFLREACAGDQSLEQEVQSLLSEPTAGSFLAKPPADLAFHENVPDFLASVLKIGAKISHYEILEKLGEGGMGVVFKARDVRLKRLVALKFIRFNRTADPQLERRLLKEARTASTFRHPNIAHLYEVDQAPLPQDDRHANTMQTIAAAVTFIAMEYVPGKTLSHIIAARPLELREVLGFAIQAADALATAHHAGIIHRDLKPGNLIVDDIGVLKILDFGLAKSIEDRFDPDGLTYSTESTVHREPILGTPAYMSPEQVEGKPLSSRSDIFSLGAVLYEMISGRRAFQGHSDLSIMSAVLRDTPASLQSLREKLPADLARIVSRCLEKDPEKRYSSGTELHQALLSCQKRMNLRETGFRAFLLRPRYVIPAAILAILAVVGTAVLVVRRSRIEWAKTQALPEISRLADQGKNTAAFALASQAEKYIPKDPLLAKLWGDISSTVSFETTPEGADVYRRDAPKEIAERRAYTPKDDAWEYLGKSPLKNIKIPGTYARLKFKKQDYDQVERTTRSAISMGKSSWLVAVGLRKKGEGPAGMVQVASGKQPANLLFPGYEDLPEFRLDDFWLDKYEVTNRQYREFLRSGGYEKREYWKNAFRKDGRALTWEQAMPFFRDATGQPGPAGWVQGEYPASEEEFPVTGVSWFEAAAYAEFAGKALPTVYHWSIAADTEAGFFVVPASNFLGNGPTRVGSFHGISPYGAYDMAGNAKEWCWNEAGSGKRYILGGAWDEASYQFASADARSPFDRDPRFGFRCVKYTSSVPKSLLAPITRAARDYSREKPVSDALFRAYKSLYSYDNVPLHSVVDSSIDTGEYWKREKITFAAAYGNERMIAYLFVPKKARPPYQTVIFFPGSYAIELHSSADLSPGILDFIIKSGRALMCPVYKGTFERKDDLKSDMPDSTSRYRDHVIDWSKDLGRSIDYLETRPDIDREKLAYFGFSWGGALGSILPAVETRLKVCVLLVGGFSRLRTLPEVDQINFAPRVKQPVLLLSGRYDFYLPVETSQNPMFRLFAAPNKDKRHVIYDSSHWFPRAALIQETLAWYDRYLGTPKTVP